MKVNFVGRKVSLRDNFKELAAKKLSRFERIFDEDTEANVIVTVEKNRQTVEITIKQHGMIYRAESTEKEMNDALDDVVQALGRQIRKNKSKLEKKIKSAGIDQLLVEETPQTAGTEAEEGEYQIVRSKRFFVKPLSVDEAVLQMNMLNHQFFMFRHETTGEINVVYRRKDGNYGLLEPGENDDD